MWLALLAIGAANTDVAQSTAVATSTGVDDHLLSGNYKLRQGLRCNEHFDVIQLAGQDSAKCLEACLKEERCSKFSVQTNGTLVRECFLFEPEAECWEQEGWVTGHKDTRCGISPQNSVLNLKCPFGTVISDIKFASYGTAVGDCGNFTTGTCHEPMTKEIVADVCVGEQSCSIAASSKVFGDPCPVISKSLRVQAVCEAGPNFNEDTYFNAWSSRHWPKSEVEVPARTAEWTSFLRSLPDYPVDQYSGRGIIVVAGGKYLESALVMIKMLRESGTQLRIQVWHLGEAEMPASHRVLLEPYKVETKNFEDYVSSEALAPIQANVGLRLFQLKPLAILHSDFEEVLLLDSDNCPIRDPSYLFEDKSFKEIGTVFWPDYWKTSEENPIWKIIGVEPSGTWEQESGQILIRKSTAWKAINLCVHFNTEFYMRLLNGDKDTFRFSWLASGVDFMMMDTWPTPVGTMKELHSDSQGFCGHTMLQHDFEGAPLFVHHNQLKSASLEQGENFKYQKFAPPTGHFKAVPVIGLKLPNGNTIPCTDVWDDGDVNIDSDRTTVNRTDLVDFENRYFRAKASIPAGVFKQDISTAEKKVHSELTRAVSHRLASPQRAMRTAIANQLRKNQNTTCTATEFEVEAPTFSNDRVCETATVCTDGSVEVTAPSATSDRVCSQPEATQRQFVVRTAGEVYEVRNNTGAAAASTIFVPSMALTLTRLITYEFVMSDVASTAPFMITLNKVGGWSANPYETGVVGSDATGSSSLSFTPAVSAPSQLYYESHAASDMGGVINIVEPTFRAAFEERTHRFTTAYAPEHIVFTRTDTLGARLGHSESAGSDSFARLRFSCEAQCATTSNCRGIYVFKTNKRVQCNGLSHIGAGITDSKVLSQSILKVVA